MSKNKPEVPVWPLPDRLLLLFAAVGAASVLVSCGGGGASAAPNAPPPVADTPPPVVGVGLASDCFNPALYTAGTTYQLNYFRAAGFAGGSYSISGSAGAPTSFNGIDGLTPVTETMTSGTRPPLPSTFYYKIEGLDILKYGSVEAQLRTTTPSSPNQPTVVQITSVYNPPQRQRMFTLAPGGTWATDGNVTQSFSPLEAHAPTNTEASLSVTYYGQRSITVPAGTFTACDFGGPLIIKGKGIVAARYRPDLVEELTSGSINGVPL